jgi:protein-L-isoaspartate(D-aspartate) O-methyltransferase
MTAVPRHLFVPEVPLAEAYGLDAVVTHRDAQGVPTSSASAPGTVAGMLEQTQVRPGQRVLEVGDGTGYNAALLAHLVGPSGSVTTIEYDAEVAEVARAHLAAYGADRVRVVAGDGTLGAAEDGPFDRILVTAGAWDVAQAWVEQLAPDGRVVLPLRLRGLTRVVAFERTETGLRSLSVEEDGFIPMKGIGVMPEKNIPLGTGPDLALRIDDAQPVETALLNALDSEPALEWTDVVEPWAWTPEQGFWLATLPGFCRVFVDADAVAAGRIP